jgi:transcriptional regulator PpsR
VTRVARPPATDVTLLPREVDAAQAQRLIEAAGDVSLLLDADGVVLEVLAPDREVRKVARRDWRGRQWVDLVAIDSRDKVRELVSAALTDSVPSPRHINHTSRTGPDEPYIFAAVRVAGSARSRTQTRVVAIGRDLRDTVELQRRLVEAQQTTEREHWRFREAETRYRTLFQASDEAVLIVDGATLRIVEANPAAQTLIGAPGRRAGAGMVGLTLANLFATDAAQPLATAVATARSVGRHERFTATIAGTHTTVVVAMASFRQDETAFLLIRLAPVPAPATRRAGAGAAVAVGPGAGEPMREVAFVRATPDAVAFTDGAGRVLSVNRAFARLAQLSSEDQARGEALSRWLGRTGVELSVLIANLRESGTAGLFVTELRGGLGLVTEVEIAAASVEGVGPPTFAFSLRDVGRRLAPAEAAAPASVSPSVQQLTELVGRVPLKQIVSETSDLIERLSIEAALTMTRDNRAMAAQLLGLSRQSLYVKLRRFGMGGLEEAPDGA